MRSREQPSPGGAKETQLAFLTPLTGLSLCWLLYTHDLRHGLHSVAPFRGSASLSSFILSPSSFLLSGVPKSERSSKIVDVWFLKETFRGYFVNTHWGRRT